MLLDGLGSVKFKVQFLIEMDLKLNVNFENRIWEVVVKNLKSVGVKIKVKETLIIRYLDS